LDVPVPAAGGLEEKVVPGVGQIKEQARRLVGHGK
jgi:hypothetical protein